MVISSYHVVHNRKIIPKTSGSLCMPHAQRGNLSSFVERSEIKQQSVCGICCLVVSLAHLKRTIRLFSRRPRHVGESRPIPKNGVHRGEAEGSLWPQLGSSFTGKSGAENERNPLGISLVFHPKLFRALKNMKIKLGLLFKAFPIEAQCEPEICAKGKRKALPEQSSPPEIPTGPSQ